MRISDWSSDVCSSDLPSDRASGLGRTVALWSIVAVWSLPTIGLLLSSFRAERAVKNEGWWTIFTNPQLTIENYKKVLASGARKSVVTGESGTGSLDIGGRSTSKQKNHRKKNNT